MKQNQFVRLNQSRWQTFEQMCNEEELLPVSFAQSYRQICQDLAIARTRHYSPSLIEKLNKFVRLGQEKLYQGETSGVWAVFKSFRQSFANALYENRIFLWLSMLAFWGLGLIAFLWVKIAPEAVYYFLDPESIRNIEYMYDPTGNVQIDERKADSDVLMFGFYIYNNIGIAFQMFGGGALFCLGALAPLLFNSFYFGAISGHIVNIGFVDPFFSFVVTHGSFELMAIIIAGAAGCKIGYSLLNPGEYTRAYAIKIAGASVVPLIIGAFIMLVVAAMVEAFWSPLDIPSLFKYIAGALCWFYVLQQFYRGTRYGA